MTTPVNKAYANLPEHDKEILKITGTQVVSTIIYDLLRTAIVYRMGRKIAPNVFKSYKRTYALCYIARLATRTPEVSQDQKDRLADLRAKQKAAKEAKAPSDLHEAIQKYAESIGAVKR
jgi:hypothetical protein